MNNKYILALREIKNTLAQPPDRISKITIESYDEIRQYILSLIEQTLGG
uniref:Uncharacterized protein n=1 Tax=viral metagenome TaxID=1070528 RepID=A0A6M3IR38_9ZZZZ